MGELVVQLIPIALGIVASPLAIMALVAVLLSENARVNGTAYLIGWALALSVTLALSFVVFGFLEIHVDREPPLWVPFLRLLLAVVLFASAVRLHQRAHERLVAMAGARTPEEIAAAAPTLPGWLQRVSTFSPVQSFGLGVGIFVLNPVDASCAIIASLDTRLAEISPESAVGVLLVFGVVGVLPIALPVLLVLWKGASAEPALGRLREWLAAHNATLNVALLTVVGFMQLQKAVAALS